MKIGKLNLILLLSLILFTNCDNDDDSSQMQFESTATILGSDLGACACCGGWIININGEDSDKRFTELPQSSNIDLLNSSFPLAVQLNWEESEDYCGKGIIIESIELIE